MDSTKRDGCDNCAIGTASKEVSLATLCPTCATGRAPEGEGNTACSNCLAGKFKEENSDDEIICTLCGVGQFTNSSNADQCRVCDPGEYQPGNGKTSCLPCLPGKHSRADTEKREDCDLCTNGKYQDEASKSGCKTCSEGREPLNDGGTSCIDCLAGKFKDKNSADEIICTNCGAGQYTDRSNADQCKACKLGETTLIMGAATCSKCDLGQYGSTNGTCTVCPAGKYQDGKGENACKDCEKDTYLGEEGKSSKADCQQCSSERSTGVSKGNIAESACLCKRTEFYQDENKECVPCPVGADCTLRDGLQLSELSALPNHWRSSTNSKRFPECKKDMSRCCPLMKEDNTTSICSGMNLTNGTDGQCLSGYSGPLCYACAENYVKKGSECVYCSAEVNIGAVLGVYLGLCFILFVIVFIVIRKTTTLRKEGEEGYSGPDAVDFYMDLTTIMISFLQVLSAVTTTYSSVDWPESFRTTSEPFGVVNLDVSFVLPLADCSLFLLG